MSNLVNVIGKYMGKQLIDQKPNYSRYKFQFEVQGKIWNFSGFMPWTKKDGGDKKGLKPEDLTEGEEYSVGYTEYHAEGREYPSKTAVTFFEKKEKVYAKTTIEVDVNSETVKQLVQAYFKVRGVENRNLNHFIGTIIRTLYNEELKPLIDCFNQQEGDEEK